MSKKRFAVFDIDGTLIRWQLYHAAVDRLANKGYIDKDIYTQLKSDRMRWKNRENDESFKDYEQSVILAYESALPGLSVETFEIIAKEVAEEYSGQVYKYTRDLVRELKSQGYMALAISGSHQELVEHIAKQYDFDDWVGTKYERDGDSFTGNKFVASYDKKSVLEKLIQKHSLELNNSIAVGDSASDSAMLEMVDRPIAFNPDQKLYEIARKKGWEIVVERKNVIYNLNPDTKGTYVLT